MLREWVCPGCKRPMRTVAPADRWRTMNARLGIPESLDKHCFSCVVKVRGLRSMLNAGLESCASDGKERACVE